MDAIRKASGFLFYVVGSLLIVVIMLAKRGILTDAAAPYVH
jgi:hypothetical protein